MWTLQETIRPSADLRKILQEGDYLNIIRGL